MCNMHNFPASPRTPTCMPAMPLAIDISTCTSSTLHYHCYNSVHTNQFHSIILIVTSLALHASLSCWCGSFGVLSRCINTACDEWNHNWSSACNKLHQLRSTTSLHTWTMHIFEMHAAINVFLSLCTWISSISVAHNVLNTVTPNSQHRSASYTAYACATQLSSQLF